MTAIEKQMSAIADSVKQLEAKTFAHLEQKADLSLVHNLENEVGALQEPDEGEVAEREYFESETRANFEVVSKNHDWTARRFITLQNELNAAYVTLREHNELIGQLLNNNNTLENQS